MKWFLNLKITSKLGISFGIILFFLIGMAVTTYLMMNESHNTKMEMVKDLELAGFLKEKLGDHLKFVKDLEASILLDKSFEGQLDETKCGFGKWYYSYRPDSPELKIIYDKIESPHKLLHWSASEIKELQMQKGTSKEQVMSFEKNIAPNLTFLESEIKALSSSVSNKVNSDVEKSNESEKSMINIFLIIAFVVALIGIIAGIFISRIIAIPVKNLSTQAEAVAIGDLTVEIKQRYNDEIGTLEKSFGIMVGNLRDTISEVNSMSSSVVTASGEISSSTEEMAAGAQEQSSQSVEVASAVEEMTKTILENSKNAGMAAETAKKAKESAETGGKVVEDTIQGMKRIANVVSRSANTVKALGKSSDQIGEIITVIDDIADQTNLLALNAAIEAARAGEQGRGFAVVADEVRKLAERTTKATKEIADMIKSIQSDTIEAVRSMDEGTHEVSEGIKYADKAGESLREIVDVSQQVTDMVTQIAVASEEQSTASEQISKNIEAISSVTNQSATGTQQIARSAEELNRLTDGLQQLVGKFKIKINDSVDKTISNEKTVKREHVGFNRPPKSRFAVRKNGKIVPHVDHV